MKKLIFGLLLGLGSLLVYSQPVFITYNVYGSQVKDALNTNVSYFQSRNDSLRREINIYVSSQETLRDSLIVSLIDILALQLINDSSYVTLSVDTVYMTDVTGADSLRIYDDGDTTRFESNNPIKIGENSLVISTDGRVSMGGVGAYSTGNFINDEYDLVIGNLDSMGSAARIGNLEFGTSDARTVGPSLTAGGAVFFAIQDTPDGIMEFVFTTAGGDIRFALPRAGVGYGTYNPRSMIIAGPSVLRDSVMIGSYWGFDRIYMNTNANGADLGVQNSAQIGDSLLVNTLLLVGGDQFTQSDSTLIGQGYINIGKSAAPSSPNPGDFYYDTDDDHFYGWTGVAWVQLDN